MKHLVSEETIRQAFVAYNEASEEERAELARRVGPFQGELTGFVIAFGLDLPAREQTLTMTLFTLIVDAFRRSGATFRKVRKGEILHAWKTSPGYIRDLKAGKDHGYAEPEVLQVVIDNMLERDPAGMVHDAPPLVAVRILHTAVHCLNRAGVMPADHVRRRRR